jgi:carbonic anhydrase/acetyltransferase-like protein (isoleucine patch superfamily)
MIHSIAGISPKIHPAAFVHPDASVLGDVEIGACASVWPGAVLRGDYGPVRIGAGSSVQDNVVIHGVGPGSYVGESCIIGHLAFIEEAVVEDACQVGVGARVLNGARMCAGSVAAAGAVILPGTVVPEGMRAQGVPAKIVDIQNPTRAAIEAGAREYVANAMRAAASLRGSG